MATIDLTGLERIAGKIRNLVNPDARDLMINWMKIIEDDNRRGILAGLDKDGVPMVPVKYRPKPPGPIKPTKDMRGGKRSNAKKGEFRGLGMHSSGLNNNLTSAQYRLLGGPPLAPRDQFSRVITNFMVDFGGPPQGAQNWYAEGGWAEIVSTKGVPFLRYHFDDTEGLPRRDLRGVRPAGIEKARQALANWARLLIREHY